ncbi:hypothetical protein JG687_00010052 [Phytophthora cactorum]|uniref:DDE Tnp4 domain-containing protein n=1 Tax=Phytophthora cactorum TaxID=29920 RepID=A0A8T1U7W1_9STRA|nr:hypothetical protein JG687_00010052 [Phytophthora cactorum]
MPYLIVPYVVREECGRLTRKQKKFNFLDSSTRINVACTFGLWKGRFRVLQIVMDAKTLAKTKTGIIAPIVAYNLMLKLRDGTSNTPFVDSDEEKADLWLVMM